MKILVEKEIPEVCSTCLYFTGCKCAHADMWRRWLNEWPALMLVSGKCEYWFPKQEYRKVPVSESDVVSELRKLSYLSAHIADRIEHELRSLPEDVSGKPILPGDTVYDLLNTCWKVVSIGQPGEDFQTVILRRHRDDGALMVKTIDVGNGKRIAQLGHRPFGVKLETVAIEDFEDIRPSSTTVFDVLLEGSRSCARGQSDE